jgi:hypothetical protein
VGLTLEHLERLVALMAGWAEVDATKAKFHPGGAPNLTNMINSA